MTVASAWAIERATDDVIVLYFEDGHVAEGTVAVTLLTVVAIGIAKSAGVVCVGCGRARRRCRWRRRCAAA